MFKGFRAPWAAPEEAPLAIEAAPWDLAAQRLAQFDAAVRVLVAKTGYDMPDLFACLRNHVVLPLSDPRFFRDRLHGVPLVVVHHTDAAEMARLAQRVFAPLESTYGGRAQFTMADAQLAAAASGPEADAALAALLEPPRWAAPPPHAGPHHGDAPHVNLVFVSPALYAHGALAALPLDVPQVAVWPPAHAARRAFIAALLAQLQAEDCYARFEWTRRVAPETVGRLAVATAGLHFGAIEALVRAAFLRAYARLLAGGGPAPPPPDGAGRLGLEVELDAAMRDPRLHARRKRARAALAAVALQLNVAPPPAALAAAAAPHHTVAHDDDDDDDDDGDDGDGDSLQRPSKRARTEPSVAPSPPRPLKWVPPPEPSPPPRASQPLAAHARGVPDAGSYRDDSDGDWDGPIFAPTMTF